MLKKNYFFQIRQVKNLSKQKGSDFKILNLDQYDKLLNGVEQNESLMQDLFNAIHSIEQSVEEL